MLLRLLATMLAGTALGLAVTYYLLGNGVSFDEVQSGPWTRWPKSGSMDIDPYAHAMLARTAELPLAAAEGLSFFARTDSAGESLKARCDYVMSGQIPSSRYWTVSLYGPTGSIIDNPAQRFGFTSAEILRAADGSFKLTVSRHARTGNWLPVGNVSTFVLVLRLYDTLFDVGMTKAEAAVLPKIVKGHCE